MRNALRAAAAIIWALVGLSAFAGEAGRIEVLNAESYARVCVGLRTPEFVGADGKIQPLPGKDRDPLKTIELTPAAPDWIQPDFDDAGWFRGRLPLEMFMRNYEGPPGLGANRHHLVLARFKFQVDDPAQARDLKLSLGYIGGAVVYVNGKELKRGHLPTGELKPETPAEGYAENPYTDSTGKPLAIKWAPPRGCSMAMTADKEPDAARLESRWRRMEAVEIPVAMLRKGVNVLAVENHRSPMPEAQVKAAFKGGRFAYVGLGALTLSAAAGPAVKPNTGRPEGLQVWTPAPEAVISPGVAAMNVDWQQVPISESYGDPCESPRISLVGARNGVFSGRLVVSSTGPIKGLQIKVGDLAQTGGGGKLPASAVQVRLAMPATVDRSWSDLTRFDALEEAIPAEVAPAGNPKVAMVPLWLTVRVPSDALAGTYEGQATVAAEGLAPVAVPLRLVVHGWRVPDPKDFRMRNMGFLSPESVAKHYQIPLWSDKHFEYMGKSMALLAEVGSRTVLVNLAVNWYWHNSNDESMVRWVKQPDGSYKHDFTVFDKYLDLAAKNFGKPLPLRLNCWGDWKKNDKDGKFFWYGPSKVSLLDPASGKVEPLDMPALDSPDFVPFWKPVLDEARKKIEARGWFDVTCLGHNAYMTPPAPAVVSMAKKIWPDGAWGITSHAVELGPVAAAEKGESMPCRYSEVVWREPDMGMAGPANVLKRSLAQGVWDGAARCRHKDASPPLVLKNLPEEMVLRGLDGVGQLGADNFPIKGGGSGGRGDISRGGYYALGNDRGGLGPMCSTMALLAPGAQGPVATERFEMFREGVQVGEALLFLERAVAEGRVQAELAGRFAKLKEERLQMLLAEQADLGGGGGTWSDIRVMMPQVAPRAARLFALCAEVAAAGGK
jgi:hypothetical protein